MRNARHSDAAPASSPGRRMDAAAPPSTVERDYRRVRLAGVGAQPGTRAEVRRSRARTGSDRARVPRGAPWRRLRPDFSGRQATPWEARELVGAHDRPDDPPCPATDGRGRRKLHLAPSLPLEGLEGLSRRAGVWTRLDTLVSPLAALPSLRAAKCCEDQKNFDTHTAGQARRQSQLARVATMSFMSPWPESVPYVLSYVVAYRGTRSSPTSLLAYRRGGFPSL